jgi:hypothetical protein
MIETKEILWDGTTTDTGEEQLRHEQLHEEYAIIDPEIEQSITTLFENGEAEHFRTVWLEVQGRFVDDPIDSVREADNLVNAVLENIEETLENKKMLLEDQWTSGGNVSTEELLLVLKQYRSFFNRLLSLVES